MFTSLLAVSQAGSLGQVGVNAARTVMVANKFAQECALQRTVMEAKGKQDLATCSSVMVR